MARDYEPEMTATEALRTLREFVASVAADLSDQSGDRQPGQDVNARLEAVRRAIAVLERQQSTIISGGKG